MELKEDRSLFARMLVVCKSRPDINLKESIGKYEFSVVPRFLFAADGTMLHCSMKSKLMTILENSPWMKFLHWIKQMKMLQVFQLLCKAQ